MEPGEEIVGIRPGSWGSLVTFCWRACPALSHLPTYRIVERQSEETKHQSAQLIHREGYRLAHGSVMLGSEFRSEEPGNGSQADAEKSTVAEEDEPSTYN